MGNVWQERSEDDVVTLVWVGSAAGLVVSDDAGSAGIRLDPDQLRSMVKWLDETLAER